MTGIGCSHTHKINSEEAHLLKFLKYRNENSNSFNRTFASAERLKVTY